MNNFPGEISEQVKMLIDERLQYMKEHPDTAIPLEDFMKLLDEDEADG